MSRIKQIKLQNFKSYQDIQIELKDLNILIGKNGSGKSNLLSFLRLMQHGVNEQLSSHINFLGGFSELRWKGAEPSQRIAWEISYAELPSETILYTGEIGRRGASFAITKEELSIQIPPEEKRLVLGAYNGVIRYLYPKLEAQDTNPNAEQSYNDSELLLARIRNPINSGLPDEIRQSINDWTIFRGFGETAIAHIYDSQALDIVSPLRLHPEGTNLISVLYALANEGRYAAFQDELEETLRDAFPDFRKLRFPLSASGRAELKWTNKDNWDFPARSLSDGILRFLGLATLLLLPQPPALIAIDEPEIGLHPSLLPLLAALLKQASKRSQIIVATHSPQLLSAESISADDVVVVEKENGQSSMNRLDADKLRIWLERYTLGGLWTMGKLEQAL